MCLPSSLKGSTSKQAWSHLKPVAEKQHLRAVVLTQKLPHISVYSLYMASTQLSMWIGLVQSERWENTLSHKPGKSNKNQELSSPLVSSHRFLSDSSTFSFLGGFALLLQKDCGLEMECAAAQVREQPLPCSQRAPT